MRWQLSEEQDAYRETLAGWLADVAPPDVVRRWLDAGDSLSFADRFAGDGWSGVGLPESIGGQGGGLVELALTSELLAHACAPSATWLATVVTASALAAAPAALAVGQGVGNVAAALTGDPLALLSPADDIPGEGPRLAPGAEGRLRGTVRRVLAGGVATRFIAVVDEPDGAAALRLVSAEGVRVVARHLLDRSRSVADVVVDDEASESLDVDASAFLAECAARAAVLTAADTLGAMAKMLDMTVAYSKQRQQFGVPIGSFQAVKHAAATILVEVEAARSAVYYAAASVDAAAPQSDLHAAAVKAQVTAAGSRVADSALTLHGAIGYTWEHDLQLFYKRAKLNESLYGRPAAWNERIASALVLA
ncbi:alkylation response protein AidB-like acyl-CoA dehydrogenase [Kribbella sp. VKM Ac-2527]|uniref:Alkylation response protein AidB-like acyl-CoA dehydrogenase n=1 Tax=Kribbella caucasensis TaxID=2512215 RepID=A0A4R6KAM1_9ACTN|nr:acyl-CoA dehydrogenase family protein [Kribbella sp. VKM Ac-2527]TDO46855.1 alkylation response protein AidB-like acyl-CoA dehydrogenase [Kribbella sp. VKM Ac-2527]